MIFEKPAFDAGFFITRKPITHITLDKVQKAVVDYCLYCN